VARLFGRALDENGQLISDTTRQEHYVEDRFNLPVEAQSLFARAGSNAGTNAFRMPDALARQLISHAFLGQLDVNPLGSPTGGTGDLKEIELWAQNVSNDQHAPVRLRVAGASHVAGGEGQDRPARGGDGRIWEHEIKLDWDGFIEMHGSRITRLVLRARGSEKLKWGNPSMSAPDDVACLPGGHPIDLSCRVHYGILGEPATLDATAARTQ
jgi:hypothetical protein